MDHQHSRKQMASPDVALANDVFDQFCNATTLKSILGHFRHLCELLKIKPTHFHQFYPKLKSKLRSWKAQALWKKFDQRANHKCYNRGKACLNTRVLIIGGGPCGMRSAIEAQLLGAKVVVVEKRDRMSRNNVLHLWPFVIQDLRALGAKKFFGKFCAGSIDHISIRQLQCILLKVALILGVEFHESVSFEALVPPPENQADGKIGWRAKTVPADHPVSQYEFDVLIGADGKRNTLEGFKRKEFRGKLAIAITANFINKRTEAEARVEEISGVAFIFNQKFFKELYQETGIDLENIVYYKDDTHYFVMTAKKHSLIDKGVILQDHADTAKLLAKENVDREALMLYAREAAEFSTEYQMMDMEFAVNHYGQPDVAMFDFTSMYAAENASRVLERCGHRLLMILVGDSLLEPFWPTGSGCARGFLSSLDACWAIKGWGGALTPLEVIAERESIYRLLGQTTPENLNRDYAAYTLDPHTRYPNLNVRSVTTVQVRSLLDTDDPETFKLAPVQTPIDLPKKRRRRDSQVHPDTLLHWLQRQVALYDGVRIHDMGVSFKSGLAIAAIINRYRPDLVDFHALKKDDPVANNQLAFDILEKELGIPPIMTGEEMVQCEVPDKLTMFSYLTQIYEAFRGEIPHIKHPKLEPETEDRPAFSQKLNELTAERKAQLLGRLAKQEVTAARARRSRHVNENLPLPADKKNDTMSRRHARKRRSTEKMGATVEERMQRLQDIEKNRLERMLRRQYQRKRATQQFYKSMQMLQANAKRDKDEPFEDYSIFLYRQTAADFKDRVKDLEQKILYPDREPKLHAGHHRGSIDEGFSGRIKNIEEKLKGTASTEKKPKDLLRAIGKIEKTDWNVKEIEKKIEENKMGRSMRTEKVERVPKWSREQFLARQTKMEKKGREPMETDSKYADIDSTLKSIDRKIKEGNVLGHNKVSAMAEQFANKNQDAAAAEQPKVQRSNSKVAVALPAQGGSEMCHFCEKRVYLMERLTAEGKSFHRGCFRCEYCSISLRIGNHTFDRDKTGGRFYCTQHFGLPGTMKTRIEKKKTPLTSKENIPQTSNSLKAPEKGKLSLEGISGLDLLDRGQTPERIEFENLAGMSDAEEAQSIMDEDEWTDRNFGPSAAEMGSSDDISDMSDSDDDNEVFEEAIDQPLTTEGTLELAKNWTLRYSHPHPATAHSDTGSNEYEDSSDEYTSTEEDSQTATEDEEDVRARELRKKEVWLQVPPRSSDTETGSETEVKLSQISNGVDEAPAIPSAQTSLPLIEAPTSRPRSASSLPDAIPSATGSQLSLEMAPRAASSAANLPDLVASSPKLSRQSSRVSLASEDASFASLEDPREHEPEAPHGLTVTIAPPSSDDWLELEEVLSKSDAGLARPILTVTAPTPTNERPAESPVLEPSRLLVPKEKQPQREESPSEVPTSFDNLLQELRQRKAKNKAEAEAKEALKPLTTESAKLQMSKYFGSGKAKPERRLQKKLSLDNSEETSRIPSPTRRLSEKIDKKDILKYFAGSSFDSTTSSKSKSPVSEPITNGNSRRSLSKDRNDDKTENEDKPDFDDDLPVFPRPRISDKVDKKDLLKYFKGASVESKSSVKSGSPITDDSSIMIDSSAVFENESSEVDALDLPDIDLEVDDVEREFNEIEQQNKNNLELLETVEPTDPLPKTDFDLFDDLAMTDFDTDVPPTLEGACQPNDDIRQDIDLSSFSKDERKPVIDDIDLSVLLKDEQVTLNDELSKDIDLSEFLKEENKLDVDDHKIEADFERISKRELIPVSDDFAKEILPEKSQNITVNDDSAKEILTEKSQNIFKGIDTTVDLIPASSRILQSIMNKTDRAVKEVGSHQVNQSVFQAKLDSEIFAEKPTKLKGPKICVVEPVKIKTPTPPEILKENSPDRKNPITAADSKIVKHKPPTPPPVRAAETKTKETSLPKTSAKPPTPPPVRTIETITKETNPTAKPPLPVKKTAAVAPRPPPLPPKFDLTIHRVVVKQQEILPVKVSTLQRVEPQRACLEPRPASPLPEPPRRPSREGATSVSQPTSPVAPARGLRSSDLRKSLSIRLGRRPEAPSSSSRADPASSSSSRGSDLHTSTKSADTTSKARKDKDKCVIS